MAIPSVVQGLVWLDENNRFNLDSTKGRAWLESVSSFRFQPKPGKKPYTVRKESGKGGDYWYGYRKQDGKLHKKYIGKSSEISTAKLEEIAEALNTPPQSRVKDKVTQVTETSDNIVTDRVTDTRDSDRLTALELQVQALAESLEALRSKLPGKSESGNSEELPKVADHELQTELGNSQAENETLKADYAKLLESSTHITNKLQQEVQELRSQLVAERADREEVETELAGLKQNSAIAEASKSLSLPDLKIAYEGYKKEKKPGRTFTISELKPFYAAILKALTPEKVN